MRKRIMFVCGVTIMAPLYGVALASDIVGVVQYQGTPPKQKMLKPNKDVKVCGTHERPSEELIVSASKGVKNAVVYIEKAPTRAKPQKAVLDQKKCVFIPHVLVTTVGSELVLANSDPLMHNIHLYCLKNTPFNESIPKGAKPVPSKLRFTEEIKIGCDVHKWMSAWIIVRDNPYYAVTDADGKYTIKGVPAGSYKLVLWHELLGKQTVDVKVGPAGAVTQNFNVSR